ncbi:uncharacterized protein LOC144907751 isoform X2 [Branchiostoma floridae x Branchiostoma belcheri]
MSRGQKAAFPLYGHLLFLCGCFLIIIPKGDCTVTVDDFIPAQTGQDVTAVWNYVQPQGATQLLRVDWFLEPGPSAIITFFPPSTSAPAPGYANKVEASVTDSEARLTIKNFDDTSDEGRYRCEITFLVGSITETEEARTVVAVPVPPSPASPSISGYAGGTFVASGSPLTLTCTSQQGKPPADLTWYKGTTPLSAVYSSSPNDMGQGDATSVLNIAALQQADNGAVYQCRASQPALAQDQNTQVTVSVAFFEDTTTTITGFPGTAVNSGTSLTLTCTSGNSNPAASITWSRDGGPAVTGTNNQQQDGSNGGKVTTQDLVISVQPEHNGARYTCRATNSELGLDRDSSEVGPLIVRFFQSGITISGNSPVTAGGRLTLICTSGNSNPAASITWSWAGSAVTGTNTEEQAGSNGGKVTTQQLVLSNLQPEDNGTEVRCAATNSGLSQTQEDTVIVVVNYEPQNVTVTCNPSDLSDLREGGDLECTCTADSNPAARYTWTYSTAGSTASLPTGAVVDQTAGTLTFNTLDREHSGEYSCTARNSISSASSGSITVDVKYPPSIMSITPAVTVDEFDDVSLTCTADSNPEPTEDSFSWTNMTDASLPGDLTNQGFTLTTTISNITYLEAGTYTCTAYNGIGAAASAVTNVTVEYAPKFHPAPDRYPAAIGDDVSMECSAFAVPNKITFTWSKNGTVLTNSSRLTVQSSGEISVLSISGVEEGDYGTYNCTAENGEGSSNTTRILQPQGPPSKPTGLAVVSKNAEFEVGITWTAGFNGGLDTTHTVQLTETGADQWEDVAREEQAFSQQHLTFDVTLDLKAQEAGDYQIRIEARNSQGRNMSDPVDLKLEGNQRLYGTITRNIDWVEALKDKQSDEFREKAALWERNLDNFFNPRFVGYEGATITQFSQGSIVGTFEAVVAQSETQDAIQAFNAQINAGSVGDLTVIKESSTISDTQPADPPSSFPLVPVVAVVCAVLLVAIIGVGVFVVRRRKSANDKKDLELRERKPKPMGIARPYVPVPDSPTSLTPNMEDEDLEGPYATSPSVPMAGGNPYDDVHFEGDGTTAPVAGATAGPLDPNVQYATVNKNNNETPNPSTIYAQVDKDKKKKDKEKPTLVVDPSSEYATVDKSKKKKKDMPPPPEDPSAQYSEVKKDKKKGKKDMPPTPEDPSAQYSEVKKDKKKGKKDMPPTPEDPSAQYSEVKKDKKKDKKAPAPDVIYTEVVKDKKDKKEKKDKKKPTPGKKPAVAKKPTAKDEERLYDEVPKAEGAAAAITDENPYENPQESMPEKQKNPQGLIYAELSDFQVKPPPKKPSKPAPPKPRYEDEPTEYASINWNASRRRAKEREQSGSTTDDETPVTMI